MTRESKSQSLNVRLKKDIADKAIMCAQSQGFNLSEYMRIALSEKLSRDASIWMTNGVSNG